MHAGARSQATSPPSVGVCFRSCMTIASCGSVNRSVANCLNIIFGIPRRCPLSPLTSSISESLRAALSLDAMPYGLVQPPANLASCVERSASSQAIQPEPWQAWWNGKSAAIVQLARVLPEIRLPETRPRNGTDATQRTYCSHSTYQSSVRMWLTDGPHTASLPSTCWPSSSKAAA